ncbi:hypothetical protein VPH35_012963 [Triticum aestivum]
MAQKEAGLAAMSGGNKAKPHAVVVVYPLQGHLIPVTHLALRLAARGFAVTVVNTEAVHDQTARARPTASPWGSIGRCTTTSSWAHCSKRSLATSRRCSATSSSTRPRRASSPTPSSCGRRRWPGSSVSRTCPSRRSPRSSSTSTTMSTCSPTTATSDATSATNIFTKAFEEARGADTVEELEPSTIVALRAEKPFYAVGPIFPTGFAPCAVATSMWAESNYSHWLDAQPLGSVLYISFGSYAHVTKQELHEIAGGVLASGARFLWVMRPDIVSSDDPDPLPEGFAAASAGRGLVVPWCCLMTHKYRGSIVEVLSHAALDGFLMHCGWNSVLESVWAGVPMLCFPLLTDQFTNRRLIVREWHVGMPIGDRGAVFADEVRARIEGVMSGKEGEELWEAVKKVRATLEAATAHGGSS